MQPFCDFICYLYSVEDEITLPKSKGRNRLWLRNISNNFIPSLLYYSRKPIYSLSKYSK